MSMPRQPPFRVAPTRPIPGALLSLRPVRVNAGSIRFSNRLESSPFVSVLSGKEGIAAVLGILGNQKDITSSDNIFIARALASRSAGEPLSEDRIQRIQNIYFNWMYQKYSLQSILPQKDFPRIFPVALCLLEKSSSIQPRYVQEVFAKIQRVFPEDSSDVSSVVRLFSDLRNIYRKQTLGLQQQVDLFALCMSVQPQELRWLVSFAQVLRCEDLALALSYIRQVFSEMPDGYEPVLTQIASQLKTMDASLQRPTLERLQTVPVLRQAALGFCEAALDQDRWDFYSWLVDLPREEREMFFAIFQDLCSLDFRGAKKLCLKISSLERKEDWVPFLQALRRRVSNEVLYEFLSLSETKEPEIRKNLFVYLDQIIEDRAKSPPSSAAYCAFLRMTALLPIEIPRVVRADVMKHNQNMSTVQHREVQELDMVYWVLYKYPALRNLALEAWDSSLEEKQGRDQAAFAEYLWQNQDYFCLIDSSLLLDRVLAILSQAFPEKPYVHYQKMRGLASMPTPCLANPCFEIAEGRYSLQIVNICSKRVYSKCREVEDLVLRYTRSLFSKGSLPMQRLVGPEQTPSNADVLYVKNCLSQHVRLELPFVFDPTAADLSAVLVQRSLEEMLEIFYQHFDLENLIVFLQAKSRGNSTQGQLLPVQPAVEFWLEEEVSEVPGAFGQYPACKEKYLSRKGVIWFLEQVGILKEERSSNGAPVS